MTKQEEFLWIVQTTIIGNCINLSTHENEREGDVRHIFSASGVMVVTIDALMASKRIPDDMDTADAAADFISYMLPNLRQKEKQCPRWFSNN